MIRLSAEARNLNWLVSNFVDGVPGVSEATVVSSDGLLIALSDGLDRSSGDRLAAVSAGLLSIAKGGVDADRRRARARGHRRDGHGDALRDAGERHVGARGDRRRVRATSGSSATRWPCSSRSARAALTPALDLRAADRAAEVGDPMSARSPRAAPTSRVAQRRWSRPVHAHAGRTHELVAAACSRSRAGSRLITPDQLGRSATPEDRRIVELCQTRCRSPSSRRGCCCRSGSCACSSATSSTPAWCMVGPPATPSAATDVALLETAAGGDPCVFDRAGRSGARRPAAALVGNRAGVDEDRRRRRLRGRQDHARRHDLRDRAAARPRPTSPSRASASTSPADREHEDRHDGGDGLRPHHARARHGALPVRHARPGPVPVPVGRAGARRGRRHRARRHPPRSRTASRRSTTSSTSASRSSSR